MPAPKAPATGDPERDARATRVRELRKRLKLSQDEFAKRLGLSRASSVSELETGTAEVNPTLWLLLASIERHGLPPATPTTGDSASDDAAALRAIASNLGAIASRIETRGTDAT